MENLDQKPIHRKPIYFNQEDPRWRDILFSTHDDPNQTIGTSGCGPTSFAMVVSNLCSTTASPPEICDFVLEYGYRTYDNGVEHAFIETAAAAYGLKYEMTTCCDRVMRFLKSRDGMILCALGVGHFTGAGHFIVLYDIESDEGTEYIQVMDPNMDNKRYWKYNDHGVVEVYEKDDGFVKAKASLIHRENRVKRYYLLSV